MDGDLLLAELYDDPLKDTWKHTDKLPPPRADEPWKPGIKKLSYTHEALVDLIITHPELNQGQYAAAFGYSEMWLSSIIHSDAFREKLAVRKKDILNPELLLSIEEKFRALVDRSANILMKKLATTEDADLALGVLNATSKALGYGAKQIGIQVNQYVVEVPPKAVSSDAWAQSHLEKAA